MLRGRHFSTMLLAVAAVAVVAAGGGCAGGRTPAAARPMPRTDPNAVMAEIPAIAGSTAPASARATTVIVVRHAEKAAGQGDDPHLSAAGEARARALSHALEDAGVTAVITTQFVRTGETAAPAAREAGITAEVVPVKWDSLPLSAAAVAKAVGRHTGGVVLVVGHSNTLPDIVAALGGEKPDAICDSEYDRMEIVTVESLGRARVIESRYGAPSPAEAGCGRMK